MTLTPKQLELNRRRRVVSGWRFREDYGPRERNAVRAYLRGGDVPEDYKYIDKAIGQRKPIRKENT